MADSSSAPMRGAQAADRPIFWEPGVACLRYAVAFVLVGSACFGIALLLLVPTQTARLMGPGLLSLVAIATWLLLARGHNVSAAYVLAYGLWATVSLIAFFTGGVSGMAIIVYPQLILMLGWLIGTRAAIAMAVLSVATTLVFSLVQSWHLLPPPPDTPPAMRWIVQSFVFTFSVVLIGYFVRSYQDRIADARKLSSDLAERSAALQTGEAELNRAQAVAHVGSWVYDLAKDEMNLSAETCRIFGLPAGTKGNRKTYLSRAHAEDRERVALAWDEAVREKRTFDSEHRIVVGSKVRWVRQIAELEFDAQGRPIRSVGTTQDITEHQLAQEALRQSEERFRNLLQFVPSVAVQGYGMDYVTRYWNEASARLYGYSAEEAIGRSLLDLIIPPEMRSDVSQAIAEMHRSGIPIPSAELSLMRKDGSRVSVYSSHALVQIPGREPELFCIDVDLTEMRRRDAEILATQRQLTATLAAIPDLLFEVGLSGRLYDYRSTGENLLYAAPPDFVGKTVAEVLPPAAADVAMGALREAHEKGMSRGAQYELPMPNGRQWFELSVSRKPVEAGEEPRFIVLARDVTERRRLEQALQTQTERLLTGQRAARMLVMDWDIINDELKWSDSPEWLRGPLPESGKYPVYIEQVHPEDRERFAASRADGIANLNSCAIEYRLVRTDGKVIWVRSERLVLAGTDGKAARMIISVQDISERKAADAARALLETQLRESQKMEALGTLAGGIAHDFSNIVAAILGNVELVRRELGTDHPALDSLEEIGKASQRARGLVQQILAFSRRQVATRGVMSLAPVVEESVRLLRATLPAGVELRAHCDAAAPLVLADATQIEQVLLNLCSNAWHAVQGQTQAGLIEVRLEPGTAAANDTGTLRFGAQIQGSHACLVVRDNGHGMDAPTLARIFEPFFTTKAIGQGTGLGLAVVHGIVQEHQGTIEVSSTPGAGTTFRVCLPAAEVQVASPMPADARSSGDAPALVLRGTGEHLLYVDDDEAIVLLMTRLLEQQGYRISGYTDAREAMDAVRRDPGAFDLVVTDYNMPGMSGLDVAREIRAVRTDLPVALTTGYITEELRASAPIAGVQELIYKPDTVAELCEIIARLLQGGGVRN